VPVTATRLRARWHRALNRAGTVPQRAQAAFSGRGVRAYWFHDFPNFGDLITPWLLRSYGCSPVSSRPASAELASTGSLLQWLSSDFAGTVLGSGMALDRPHPLVNARIAAVRGARTRDLVDAPAGVALGDPGLLAVHRSGVHRQPQVPLGLVPHYYDRDNPVLVRLAASLGRDCRGIDVRRPPDEVFADVAACETVLASSLHGVVTADALGIPVAWTVVSERVMGGAFKFLDHESALGLPRRQLAVTGSESVADLRAAARVASGTRVAETVARLDELFAVELARLTG
jgi:hypothetical protein